MIRHLWMRARASTCNLQHVYTSFNTHACFNIFKLSSTKQLREYKTINGHIKTLWHREWRHSLGVNQSEYASLQPHLFKGRDDKS